MIVHSIESLAAIDGEGLRCAIFLAGCPMRCAYCHNPDTWDRRAGTEYTPEALLRKIKCEPTLAAEACTLRGRAAPSGRNSQTGTAAFVRNISYTLDTARLSDEDVRAAVTFGAGDMRPKLGAQTGKYTGGVFAGYKVFDCRRENQDLAGCDYLGWRQRRGLTATSGPPLSAERLKIPAARLPHNGLQ